MSLFLISLYCFSHRLHMFKSTSNGKTCNIVINLKIKFYVCIHAFKFKICIGMLQNNSWKKYCFYWELAVRETLCIYMFVYFYIYIWHHPTQIQKIKSILWKRKTDNNSPWVKFPHFLEKTHLLTLKLIFISSSWWV